MTMRASFRPWACLLCLLGLTGSAWTAAQTSDSRANTPGSMPAASSADPAAASTATGTSDPLLASEEAIGRFSQILQRRPLHGPAFAGLVKHYAEKGKLATLIREYEARADALPDDSSVKIVLARVYLRGGKADKAAALLEHISLPPTASKDDASKLLVLKSEVFQQTGRMDAAEAMLKEAFQQARSVSQRLKLAEALSDLHLRADDREKAAAALTDLTAAFPDSYLHRKRIAECLAQRSLHAPAVAEYRAVLKLVEGEVDKRCEVLRLLGRSLEQLERKPEAIDAYSEAVGLLSGDHWMQRELHDRIVALYRASGRLEDLVAYCRAQIERSPEQTSMRVLLADVLAASGDTDGAKQTLENAVGLFPRDRIVSEKRVQLLERLGDSAAAAAEYERIIAQLPDEFELYIVYGQFLANNRQLDAARNQWKHVLNSEVTDATLANRLGSLFEPYELFDDAVECYERAIKLAPSRPESYTAVSRLWFYRGDKEKAVDALRRMAQANPDDAATHATLCQSMMNYGMAEAALEAITRACELEPEEAAHQLNRADVLLNLGRVAEALAVRRSALDWMKNPGQRATAIDVLVSMHATSSQLPALKAAETRRLEAEPKDTVALMLLARAADFEREFAEARKWLTRLIEVDPSHEEARRHLARLLEAVGDVDGAVDAYRQLAEASPAHARQYFQAIADLKLRYNDKRGAIETFEQMVQTSSGNATVLKTVAEQLVRLEEFDKAIDLYEQALRIQAESPEVRLAYGKALQAAGRLEDSLPAFKAAAMQRIDRETAAEAMNRLHEVAGELGSIDELIHEFQAHVESDPEATQIARMLAELLIREYEYNRAMDMIDLVLRVQPREAELRLIRGEILRRLSRFDEAVETYQMVLRRPDVDRDFVLGEMGKAHFEGGRIEQAKAVWRQINHKLYAGSLLRNNGLLEEAAEVLREGIRLKPDDFGLHRNLVATLDAAGKTDEALEAAKRLLDLEPDNIYNIQQVAKAYLERGNRATAAEIAARLFSAGVTEKKDSTSAGASSGGSWRGMPLWALSMQSAWYAGQMGGARSNLDRAIQFFQENGLLAELEETLNQQLAAQPQNALLRDRAATMFADAFAKPARALELYRELETADFPLEHQSWLGQCSQRDYMRVRQYQLIGSKPGLRDQRLANLEPRPAESLSRDERLELAVIRQSQGATDAAVELLQQAVEGDRGDLVALSVLCDTLLRAERFAAAEPIARRLIDILVEEQDRVEAELLERVRRDFVRTLPVQFQLRVSEALLRDIARKWTLGQSLLGDFSGFVNTMGLFRARMSLATIYARTDRIEDARSIWKSLEPTNSADADGWTMLAGVAQLHDQNDVAYQYYENALRAAKVLAADPLLQQIYGGSLSSSWFGGEEVIDSSFNRIVEAFSRRDKLTDLYDFLRETDQTAKARRVAEQYELYDALKAIYAERVAAARESFRSGSEDAFNRSVPYFAEVCKLAELHDQTGDWAAAEEVFKQYLSDFPDEQGLLITLGEVAERQEEYAEAVEWEKRNLETKRRLQRQAREWAMRSLGMTPAPPQVLAAESDRWDWPNRWGKGYWWGQQRNQLELWPSWLRIAQLYLSLDNTIAAADAMDRAVGSAGGERKQVGQQILSLIRQRQLVKDMLPVLRSLAVYLPTEEPVQLAFAESLEANDKGDVARQVYERMLRRGVSDIGVLARVRDKLKSEQTAAAGEAGVFDTLESLEKTVAADPQNANNRLRLAKAYYYSLDMVKALEALQVLEEKSPHLEGLHDLLVEIYTIQGDSEKLVKSLRQKVDRTQDENDKRKTRYRLVEELFALGRAEEALGELKDVVDSRDPNSYERVGLLFHYFGRHDDAIAQFELSGKSQRRGGWGNQDAGKTAITRALVFKGDLAGAADKIMESVDEQARQQSQFAGMAGIYAIFDNQGPNVFEPFVSLFVLRPELLEQVEARLATRREQNPDDPQVAKHLMQLYQRVGRNDRAEEILERLTSKAAADQTLVMQMIDRAVKRRDYDAAIEMATRAIDQVPKPTLPPGLPPQFAGMMTLMSPRNLLTCKLGDIYWKKGEPDQAFEHYRRIVDEKVDESKVAFATICMLRGRLEESRSLVQKALDEQQVKSPLLLQFSALLAALDNDAARAFDLLAEAIEVGTGTNEMFGMGGAVEPEQLATLARQTNQIDRFAQFMKKRIKKNPSDWSNHQLLAQTYHDLGRIDDAEKTLARASRVKALRREVMQQRITWMESHAAADELIAAYREYIEASEKQVKAETQGGVFSRLMGGRAVDERPADTQALRDRLGQLLWAQGREDEAREAWTQRMNLQSAASHAKLASHLSREQAFDAAEAAYRKALDLQPDHQASHSALVELAYCRGDAVAALKHLCEVFVRSQGRAPDADPTRQFQPQDEEETQFDPAQASIRALELARDGAVQEYLASGQAVAAQEAGANPRDAALALAVLAGDWTTTESLLSERLGVEPYDPMLWKLWASVQIRKGDWQKTAQAWETVRRLQSTSIPRRRDELKLVLAGKHIKEAAAGSRQAQMPGALSGMMSGGAAMSYVSSMYDSYRYARQDDVTSTLASLYVKLGEYDRAERLYLFGSGSVEWVIPSLSSLMWRQDAKDRALELMTLAVVLTDGSDSIPQYASLLAEVGRADEAVDLLVRAYRCARQDDMTGSRMAMMMYGYYGGYGQDENQFEDYREQSCSSALFDILKKGNALEKTLASLRQQAAENADDTRLGKLVLGLQFRAHRWDQARAVLADWCKARPEDAAVRLKLLQAHLQLGDWEAALAMLGELSKESGASAGVWRSREAFVHLMRGDMAAALQSVEGLLARRDAAAGEVPPMALPTVLLLTRNYDRLIEYYESRDAEGRLEDTERYLLCMLLEHAGRPNDAVKLALTQVWKTDTPLDETAAWFAALSDLLARAGDDSQIRVEADADSALLTLIREGAPAGAEAFAAIVQAHPDNLNARRGLVLARSLAGDWAAAVDANRALVEWLAPRRRAVWQESAVQPLSRPASALLQQFQSQDLDTSAVMGLTMSFSQIIGQLLGSSRYGEAPEMAAPRTYEPLWLAYTAHETSLLARAGDIDALKGAFRQQATLAASLSARQGEGSDDPYGYRTVRYRSGGGYVTYTMPGSFDGGRGGPSGFTQDWRSALREALKVQRLFEPLIEDTKSLARRLPAASYGDVSEWYAALGSLEDARAWRSRLADSLFVTMQSTDQPSVASETDRYGWWWYRYARQGSQEVAVVRRALQSSVFRGPVEPDAETRSPYHGAPRALWELATVDDAIASRLTALESHIGPGWGDTATLRQLISYYWARRDAERVIALLSKVFEPDRLLQSQWSGMYLNACFESGQYDRIEALLTSAAQLSSTLETDILLTRLVLQRHRGEGRQADELERSLIERSREIARSPVRLDPDLASRIERMSAPAFMSAMQQFNPLGRNRPYMQRGANPGRLETVADLAGCLGVEYESGVADEDCTLVDIQQAYQRHRHYADAARMVDLRLSRSNGGMPSVERMGLLLEKAEFLAQAGDVPGGRGLAAEIESYWTSEAQARPVDAAPYRELATLYNSRAWGKDRSKAYAAFLEARKREPSYDVTGLREADYLVKLDRAAEAWPFLERSLFAGRKTQAPNAAAGFGHPSPAASAHSTGVLYAAGLSAHAAGKSKMADELLRQALWRDPLHKHADKARELIND